MKEKYGQITMLDFPQFTKDTFPGVTNMDIFSGLFWTGERSVELGLADGFGDTRYVARDVIKAPRIVDYTVKESFSSIT